jgi:hypothetical protein
MFLNERAGIQDYVAASSRIFMETTPPFLFSTVKTL